MADDRDHAAEYARRKELERGRQYQGVGEEEKELLAMDADAERAAAEAVRHAEMERDAATKKAEIDRQDATRDMRGQAEAHAAEDRGDVRMAEGRGDAHAAEAPMWSGRDSAAMDLPSAMSFALELIQRIESCLNAPDNDASKLRSADVHAAVVNLKDSLSRRRSPKEINAAAEFLVEAEDTEREAVAHQADVAFEAKLEKANISEHAAGARADISDAEAAAHAEVDAKVEAAKPEEEKVSPEQLHDERLVELRSIRDRALQASRHMDMFTMGQAVHDLADLLYRFFDDRLPRLVDPLESELVGHHRPPVRE